MARSQIFIGRLPLNVKEKEIEHVFEKYGRLIRCDVKYGAGMAYAFVDYEDLRDAADAIKYENGTNISGSMIVVEWARGPASRQNVSNSWHSRTECYLCHRTGHRARDCWSSQRYRGGQGGGGGNFRRNDRGNSNRSHYRRRSYTRSRSSSRERLRRKTSRSKSSTRSRSSSRGRRDKKVSKTRDISMSKSRSVSPSRESEAKSSHRASRDKSPSFEKAAENGNGNLPSSPSSSIPETPSKPEVEV